MSCTEAAMADGVNPQEHWRQVYQSWQIHRYQIITMELKLAKTFCQVSLNTHNPDTAIRNAGHANRAYDVAVQYFEKSNLNGRMKLEIAALMDTLAPLLSKLPKEASIKTEGEILRLRGRTCQNRHAEEAGPLR
jgi:hypothetical protein